MALSAVRRELISLDLESGEPSWNRNKGPGIAGRWAKYPSMDVMGHNGEPVAPKWRVVPTSKESFLLRLSKTVMQDGDVWESTVISLGESISEEKAGKEIHVNSPERMNPKKPRQNAAQSTTLSKVNGSRDHIL